MQPFLRLQPCLNALISGLLVFLITACAVQPLASPESTSSPTLTLTPQAIQTILPTQKHQSSLTAVAPPTPAATPAPAPIPRTAYHLDANFDYTNHTLEVQEKIIINNPAEASLNSLVLVVEANHYPKSFSLSELSISGASSENYTLDDHRLEITLPEPLLPRQSLVLDLAYRIDLPAIPPPADNRRPVPFGWTSRQSNLVDWYPYLAAYQPGKGWLLHDPWVFGEHQVQDAADFQVNLTLKNPPADLVLAGSAPATRVGDNVMYQLSAGRSFAISASESYSVTTQMVEGITVTAYTFSWDARAGEQVLKDTASALQVYGRLFGPYPRTQLSVVEADFLDGMEYDGLYFLSRGFYNLYDGSPAGYLTAITVHETAHQWWYAAVGNDQAIEPWLDEGMSTYAERLFYEQVYPELSDWWWAFRIDFYKPEGWVNHPIYDYSGFTLYRNSVYLRGASFLEDLRIRVGDEAFFAFLKDFTARYSSKRATSADFFAVLAEHSPSDLAPLLKIYFDPLISEN